MDGIEQQHDSYWLGRNKDHERKLLVLIVALKIDHSICGRCVLVASDPGGVNFMFC
jgi:hypothetical protein